MLVLSLAAVPAQTFQCVLAQQACTIAVYQKTTGLYLDLALNNLPLAVGAICRNRVAILRAPYSAFVGDLVFYDLSGGSDPDYTGLVDRYVLAYIEASDTP